MVYTCWYEPTQSEPKWHHCELSTKAIRTCAKCIAMQNFCLALSLLLSFRHYSHFEHSDRRLIMAGQSDVSPWSGDPRPKLVLVSLSWRSHPMRHVERHPLCLGRSKELGKPDPRRGFSGEAPKCTDSSSPDTLARCLQPRTIKVYCIILYGWL